jgi:hypothetical protein
MLSERISASVVMATSLSLSRIRPARPLGALNGHQLNKFLKSLAKELVLLDRIELSTSPLPMECSTTELQQQRLTSKP